MRGRLVDQPHLPLDVDVRLDEGHCLHDADLLDARNRRDLGRQPVVKAPERRWAGVSIPREHLYHHDVLAIEAGIDVQQVHEAAQQEAGACDEHQRHRHFGDHERGTKMPLRSIGRHGAIPRPLEPEPREAYRGHQPGGERDGTRQQYSETNRRCVDVERVDPHHLARAPARQASHRGVGQEEGRDGGGGCQHQCLDEQLAHQPSAVRAKCRPHGQFLLP